MTSLTDPNARAVVRETAHRDYRTNQPLAIRLNAGGKLISLRPKGTVKWYTLTIAQAWDLALKNERAHRSC